MGKRKDFLKVKKKRKIRSSTVKIKKKDYYLTKWLNLASNCGYNGYKIKELSKENGDCLFESILLASDKYSNDMVSEFKEEISEILKKNKNKKYLDNLEGTLEEIFNNFNDIPNYTYDKLVNDVRDGMWTRINTHLLLTIMSKKYNLDFKIINNTVLKPINISTHNSKISKEIPIGHLLEYHYVPLVKI